MADKEKSRPGLDEYEKLDLSEDSDLRKKLMAHVETEAGQESITLSDPHSAANPSYLTSAMLDWYQSSIAPVRQRALAEIVDSYTEVAASKEQTGLFYERDMQALEFRLSARKRDVYREQRDTRSKDFERFKTLKASKDQLQVEYNAMRAQQGSREPIITNLPFYIFLMSIVGVFELLINFDAFNSLSWTTPFLASGTSVIIAAVLAFAAHNHGTVLKQWEYYFGRREKDENRGAAYRMLSLGSVALVCVLGLVWYARAQYLSEFVLTLDQLGGEQRSSGLFVIGGSLLGNLLVWILGMLIAWLLHDRNPEFPAKAKALLAAERECEKLQSLIESYRRREIERAEAGFTDDLEKLDSAHKAHNQYEGYGAATALYSRFKAQDGRAVAALSAYRSALQRAAEKGVLAKIFVPSSSFSDKYDEYPISELSRFDPKLRL